MLALAGAFGYFAFVKKSEPAQPPKYPYILKPLSQTQLSSLRSEFATSNKNICTQLNEFGLTEDKSDCGGWVTISITDEASIIELAKNWLAQNSEFTGVPKSKVSDIVIDRISSNKKVIGLQISFPVPQLYNGLPVEGDIAIPKVFANAKGISRVSGHWFPEITVPLEPKISETSAKNKLNGRTFTYSDVVGSPRDYRVEQKDLSNVARKVIFVRKSSQGLEFRLSWKIPVGQELSWTVYIDAITGEELKVTQMFVT